MSTTIDYTTILMDSGNGWTSTGGKGCLLFKSPKITVKSTGNVTEIIDDSGKIVSRASNPLLLLEEFLSKGLYAVGYISYDYARFTERGFKQSAKNKKSRYPDFYFHFYEKFETFNSLPSNLLSKDKGIYKHSICNEIPNIDKNDFIKCVKTVKNYIESGDTYQVNLSCQFDVCTNQNSLNTFLDLVNIQPVPFSCYIEFDEFKIISGSMELFLKKKGGKIVTRPIKGTRKRSEIFEIDNKLAMELYNSEKDRAENLMIVDLMRNDLSRICEFGSVKVDQLFKVETYTTVHQLVSHVEGILSRGIGISDIIANTFPPGSVTGAPKRRTIEIIDELEPHVRGPYCGAIGVFYPNGDFILSVPIRIIVNWENNYRYWVGSGIVWDSDPEQEYEELLTKASAIRKALKVEIKESIQ